MSAIASAADVATMPKGDVLVRFERVTCGYDGPPALVDVSL